MMTDEERLDWLENNPHCASLVNDDNGRWAVTSNGFQNVSSKGVLVTESAIDIETAFWVEACEWKDSVREAIDAAHQEYLASLTKVLEDE